MFNATVASTSNQKFRTVKIKRASARTEEEVSNLNIFYLELDGYCFMLHFKRGKSVWG
jgi:hypothetical protein